MAPIKVGTLHFVEQTLYKAEKALVAAKFNGLAVDKRPFDVQKDLKKPDFLAKNPFGKVPYLETDMGCICTSNAIARYVAHCRADTSLFGKSFDDECQIDTWLEFCTHELEVPLATWVYPVMGLMEDAPAATKDAQADVKKALTALEAQLKASDFLIGDFVTLADIALVCGLREGFARVFDPAFRKPFPKVCAWFEKCCAMPQFSSIIGSVKLCQQAGKPQPVLPAFKPVERKEKKAEPAKADAKAKAKAEPKAKVAAAPAAKAVANGAIPSGDIDAQIKAVGDEIRELKARLKAEGLSGKKIDANENVQQLVAKLQDLKAGAPSAPGAASATATKPAAAPATAGGDVDSQIKAVGDEIRTLKAKLKAEGLSGKKIDAHDDVKRLVAQLQELKAAAPAGGAAPAAAAAPATAAPAAGGDVQAQVTAAGDEIRALKEKLKAEGLSGKKINDHEQVKSLVAKMQELKSKLPA